MGRFSACMQHGPDMERDAKKTVCFKTIFYTVVVSAISFLLIWSALWAPSLRSSWNPFSKTMSVQYPQNLPSSKSYLPIFKLQ